MPIKIKHGFQRGGKQHPFYRIWANMIQRCKNPNNTHYDCYGGRGISVCCEWLEFQGFMEDMLDSYQSGLTLERKDNSIGYCKSNCRWATRKEQLNNTRINRFLELNGERRTLQQWADKIGIGRGNLFLRLKRGWPIELALTAPPRRV